MTEQRAQRAIGVVLAGVERRKDETMIEHKYREVVDLDRQFPKRPADEELHAWCDALDQREEAIGCLQADSLREIEIKLTVLCDRLRKNLSRARGDMADLIIAQAARDDLRRYGERLGSKPCIPIETPKPKSNEPDMDLMRDEQQEWHELPFLHAEDGKVVDYWTPAAVKAESKDNEWSAEIDLGTVYAAKLIEHMVHFDRRGVFNTGECLTHVAEAVVKRGQWTGVELGFFEAIGDYVVRRRIKLTTGFDAHPTAAEG